MKRSIFYLLVLVGLFSCTPEPIVYTNVEYFVAHTADTVTASFLRSDGGYDVHEITTNLRWKADPLFSRWESGDFLEVKIESRDSSKEIALMAEIWVDGELAKTRQDTVKVSIGYALP